MDDGGSSGSDGEDGMGLGPYLIFCNHLPSPIQSLDSFIDDRDYGLKEGGSQQHVSWKELPDREEGLASLIDRILSRNAKQKAPVAEDDANDIDYTTSTLKLGLSPTPDDYPLWWVQCRVSINIVGMMIKYLWIRLSSQAWKQSLHFSSSSW